MASIGLLQRSPSTPGRVRQVEVPHDVRALSTLARIDYEDTFRAETEGARDLVAEEWARAILEDAPLPVRTTLRRGWSTLGLRLDAGERQVLGWEVRRSAPDFVLLAAGSRIGMPAELVLKREPEALLLATLVQKQNRLARAVWAAVDPVHPPVVTYMLERATR